MIQKNINEIKGHGIGGSLDGVLQMFEQERGQYKTNEIANFLSAFVLNDSAQQEFVQKQMLRNLNATLGSTTNAQLLDKLPDRAKYVPPKDRIYDAKEQQMLFSIYQEYLKKEGREFQLSSEQKQRQFQKILQNLKD